LVDNIDIALNAAAALLSSSVESLKGADRAGDEGLSFKRSLAAALLAESGHTHDHIAEALGFAGKSGPQKSIELVRGRIQQSSAFRIAYHRMVSQVRTASPTVLRFIELRHALRTDGQTEDAVSSLAATLVLAEAIEGRQGSYSSPAAIVADE
jgi:hypothetical protein